MGDLWKGIKINWKTSAAALPMFAAGIVAFFSPLTDGFQLQDLEPMAKAVSIVIAGVGLLLARDLDKSTEDSRN